MISPQISFLITELQRSGTSESLIAACLIKRLIGAIPAYEPAPNHLEYPLEFAVWEKRAAIADDFESILVDTANLIEKSRVPTD